MRAVKRAAKQNEEIKQLNVLEHCNRSIKKDVVLLLDTKKIARQMRANKTSFLSTYTSTRASLHKRIIIKASDKRRRADVSGMLSLASRM